MQIALAKSMSSGPHVDEVSSIRTWAGKRRAAGIMGVIGLAFLGVAMAEMDLPHLRD